MGKPKKQKASAVASQSAKQDNVDEKGKKNYSFAATTGEEIDIDGLQKVILPPAIEKDVLDLIQESHKNRPPGEVSKRLTSKKLTDVYESLSQTGFKHDQIEKAMNHIIPLGGDLVDALDWLCLVYSQDKLPEGFSETLQQEEVKKRPKFDVERFSTAPVQQIPVHQEVQPYEKPAVTDTKASSGAMKDWILQYAGHTSEEEEEGPEEETSGKTLDPNEKYLELTARLLDARSQAGQAKQEGNKKGQKEASSLIRKLTLEMDVLECHANFNPAIKIKDIDKEKDKPPHVNPVGGADAGAGPGADDDDSPMDMSALFAESEDKPKPVKNPAVKKEALDIRNFEYTRQQWTGKSPKQFLIDWVRKHLPQSKPPSYKKTQVRGNLHKCQVTVQRKKTGDLIVTPEILCENSKDAEHLGCTLALYHLCKGQSVYQLLPPPYRDVWLEWEGAEKKEKEAKKSEKNKPRDQFLSKLLKKLQMEDVKEINKVQDFKEDTEESWESLADDDSDVNIKQTKVTHGHERRRHLDGEQMKQTFQKRQKSPQYQRLAETRQTLPVSKQRDVVLQKIRCENILVIAGETGSGKSTQIPQFILQDFLEVGQGHKCNIICTQPRRISAISLANRVSEELGEAGPGSPNSFCGYQIRFESKKCQTTRLTYCTTGVLLRQLQLDPLLSEVTHVIVDEVHERTMQADFLMIVLKTILTKRKDFKVVLMSATLDSAKFSSYFYHCPVINIPGKTFPVKVLHVEDVVEAVGYVIEEDSPYSLRMDSILQEEEASVSVTEKGGGQQKVDLVWTKEDFFSIDKSGLNPDRYSLRTRNTLTRMNPDRINMDLIVDLLKFLSSDRSPYKSVDGAVLVFLPGLADIQELYELLQADRHFSNTNKYKILALHSVLSSQDQSAAFSVLPPGVRKVVIATNIAETGITIPDVVFVVDAGKAKENRHHESSRLSALEEVFISKANAKQREGRAGRVREGYCFRLYSKRLFESFREFSIPELLRVPLEELCLHIMKCDLGDPQKFLSQALDPPQPMSVSKAMTLLQEVGACMIGDHTLTPLGHHLAALPVHVRIGKMMIFGALLGCLEPVAVIAAAMTGKSPFVVPLNKRDEADLAKRAFAVSCSDHLTLYNAYLRWRKSAEGGRQAELDFCNKSFLKRNSLLEIENVKKDLIKLVRSIGFDSPDKMKLGNSLPRELVAMVKAVLTAGLYPNIAMVKYEAPVDAAANPEQRACVMETPHGAAQAHPSSINRFLKANGLVVYHEKVKHTRVYIRDSSLISPHPVLLFGGDIEVRHRQQVVSVDKWLRFQTYARTGVIYRELRLLVNRLLQEKLEQPNKDLKDNRLLSVIIQLLKIDAR
ncbi:ATP-dependent RNA helicase DHX29-like [Liolophura sinensis]|uniref:ATP-dependent RNA helicase DHX29-like n=1 Tax=Liolophura sinensis TaxID=3198878 RepID=UPI00315892C7